MKSSIFSCLVATIASIAYGVALAQTRPYLPAAQLELNPTRDAARLMQQASFGATKSEISCVASIGAAGWLTEQFSKPQSLHLDTVQALWASGLYKGSVMMPSIYKQYFEADDQLRQRVAFALSQILVISQRAERLATNPCGPASYLDMLGQHGFGNFRDILKSATLHPAMGEYLNMRKSGAATDVTNPDGSKLFFYPNENFARELLQLFSIGTVQLNLNGTPKLDGNGKPIPAYNEAVVQGFAKAFTGWNFAADTRDVDAASPQRWEEQFYPFQAIFTEADKRDVECKQWSRPMEPWAYARQQKEKYSICFEWIDQGRSVDFSTCGKPDLPPPHDTGTKLLLNGVTLPAAQTPMQDIDAAIDNIFNHPNVGPFIGKQLIQRLTMSSPPPAYVERVATVFNDNGKGVRGDMKSVIRAILLDGEARLLVRTSGAVAGKMKEPMVRWIQYFRAFNARDKSGDYQLYDFSDAQLLNQAPLTAPSVFNYYHPGATLPSQPANAPVLAPEFELASSNAVTGWADVVGSLTLNGYGDRIVPDYAPYLPLVRSNPIQLVDDLSLVLLAGQMSPKLRTDLITALQKVQTDSADAAEYHLKMVLWLIANSPEYLIQK